MDYIDAASTFTSSVISDHETMASQLATPSPPHLKPPPILPTECVATTSIDPVELPTSETLHHPQTVLCPCCNDTMTLDHVCESVDYYRINQRCHTLPRQSSVKHWESHTLHWCPLHLRSSLCPISLPFTPIGSCRSTFVANCCYPKISSKTYFWDILANLERHPPWPGKNYYYIN